MSTIGERPIYQQPAMAPAGPPAAPPPNAQTGDVGSTGAVSSPATLSGATNVQSSPGQSTNVTNAQGHAARMALGAEGGTGGISLTEQGKAETAVQGNEARKTPVDFNNLQTTEQKKAFLQNVTQLDGSTASTADGQRCGPTALVSSITMADPKATQKLAKGILDMTGNERKKNFENALSDGDKEALRRIAAGKASPEDVRVLGSVMADTKGVKVSDGADPGEMAKMLSVTTKILGDDMPNISLHLYSSGNKTGEGHWQGYANGVEIDPWPNDKGQATLTDGAAGLAQGASHYENGSVHTKMIVEDHGKRIVMPRYLGATGDPKADPSTWTRTHNDNMSQTQADYVYTQDTFGYGYTRQKGEVPPGAVGEPGAEIGLGL